MRRKLFTIAAGVSAVVFIGAGALWVKCELGWPLRDWTAGDRWRIGLTTGDGELDIGDKEVFEPREPVRRTHVDLGAVVFDQDGDRMNRARNLTIRWWGLMIASVPLPAWGIIRLSASARARRRVTAGLCARCGYDLIPSPRPVIAILPGEQQPQPQQPTPRR